MSSDFSIIDFIKFQTISPGPPGPAGPPGTFTDYEITVATDGDLVFTIPGPYTKIEILEFGNAPAHTPYDWTASGATLTIDSFYSGQNELKAGSKIFIKVTL